MAATATLQLTSPARPAEPFGLNGADRDRPPLPGWRTPEIDQATNRRGEPLRVLAIHNYHVDRGGMEVLFETVNALLEERGHHVVRRTADSGTIVTLGQKLSAFASAVHSPSWRDRIRETIERERIDIVHLYNVWPLISPSAMTGAAQAFGGLGVPVVLMLQDYKLTCPAGQHLRNGKLCTRCVDGREYFAALHGCRNGRVWSSAYALRNAITRRRGIVRDGVTLYLPCSRFIAEHHVDAGFDAGRMHLLPNFTDIAAEAAEPAGEYVAYVGRISPEKGLPVLIEAARRGGVPVRIAGDAKQHPELVADLPENVEHVGPLRRDRLGEFYSRAAFAVVPSVWYEAFGIVAAEANAHGLPVIASRIGGLAEVVVDGVTGQLVPPGDPGALAEAMRTLWTDRDLCRRMGSVARTYATRELSRERYFRRLSAAYARAYEAHRGSVPRHLLPQPAVLNPEREAVHV
jgi:glycosyltransferase involved in cell wall biosynthesis